MNPRAALTTYSLSRGAPSASLGTSPNCPYLLSSSDIHLCRSQRQVILYLVCFILSSTFLTFLKSFYFVFDKRREWDSNPRALADKRFSRPPRYDHFDISPYNVFNIFCAVLSVHVVFYHQISPLSITNLIFFSKNWTYSFNFCYMSIFTGIFTRFYSLFSFKNASATTRSSGVVILILR